jgi:membrane protein implicated in regulation of membrane protease activity
VLGWYWIVWFVVAALCFAVEIIHPRYYFMSLGIGGLVSGMFSLITTSLFFTIIVFLSVTPLSYLWLKKIRNRLFISTIDSTGAVIYETRKSNVEELIDREGMVTKSISTKSRGYVKINNDEWPAILSSLDRTDKQKEVSAEVGKRVRVVAVRDNKLIVSTEADVNRE